MTAWLKRVHEYWDIARSDLYLFQGRTQEDGFPGKPSKWCSGSGHEGSLDNCNWVHRQWLQKSPGPGENHLAGNGLSPVLRGACAVLWIRALNLAELPT